MTYNCFLNYFRYETIRLMKKSPYFNTVTFLLPFNLTIVVLSQSLYRCSWECGVMEWWRSQSQHKWTKIKQNKACKWKTDDYIFERPFKIICKSFETYLPTTSTIIEVSYIRGRYQKKLGKSTWSWVNIVNRS